LKLTFAFVSLAVSVQLGITCQLADGIHRGGDIMSLSMVIVS
jgi:hypothetical protein